MQPSVVYRVVGSIFALLCALTLLNVVAVWQNTQQLLPLSIIYATLDAAMAYAFFTRQRWLVWALGLNLLGQLVLLALRASASGVSMVPVLILIVNAALFWYVYMHRRTFKTTPFGHLVSIEFAAGWLITMYIMVATTL